MANDPTGLPKADAGEKELALWMLERIHDSEKFMGLIRDARVAGRADVLDTPNYVALHTKRIAPLYQGAHEEQIETSVELAGLIDKLAERDLLSGREDLIEKALAAYLKAHPKGDAGLPKNWQSTVDLARAEIEGKSSGAFKPGFATELATAARSELARRAAKEKGRGVGRDGQ